MLQWQQYQHFPLVMEIIRVSSWSHFPLCIHFHVIHSQMWDPPLASRKGTCLHVRSFPLGAKYIFLYPLVFFGLITPVSWFCFAWVFATLHQSFKNEVGAAIMGYTGSECLTLNQPHSFLKSVYFAFSFQKSSILLYLWYQLSLVIITRMLSHQLYKGKYKWKPIELCGHSHLLLRGLTPHIAWEFFC